MTIEEIVCNYLTLKLGVVAMPQKPKRPFTNKVFVERTGGTGRFIKETTIAVQSYGEAMYEAATLNDRVIEAMNDATEVTEITNVELNSNYNFTDTTTKEYRYQAVFDIKHY
ncbi:MAG: hypothetical protein J6W36_02735 [Clostridiales bacterium]|nr:hypothetical protein [Clostridiales bacterium]